MNLRFAALALVLFPAIAAAAPRDLVSSGRVFGPGGDALDGPHTVTFRLLDSVGAEQWTTTQSVDFDDGYYAARLTNVDPVAFTKDLTLAVGIGGVEVGRHPLAATPYALAVDGVVRVSAAPTSCTPALAGTLRYNTGTLEVCNGAAYAPLVTGSPSGSVVDYRHTQVVGGRNLTGTFPWDDTIPQNNEGSELVSVTITPKSASNLLVFEGIVNWSEPTNHSNYLTVALFQGWHRERLRELGGRREQRKRPLHRQLDVPPDLRDAVPVHHYRRLHDLADLAPAGGPSTAETCTSTKVSTVATWVDPWSLACR
jgi:hypothetical protein